MGICERINENMKLFKKKKEDVLLQKESLPRVIREGVIKPTTCKVCHTVYQASKEHIRRELDIDSRFPYDAILYTRCPICDNPNKTEFEEVSEG